MIFQNSIVLWFISLVRLTVGINVASADESGARDFLRSVNEKSAELASKLVGVQWEFEANNTESTKKELFQLTSDAIKNAKLTFQTVLDLYPWQSYSSSDIRRQLKLFSEIGTLALPEGDYHEFQKIFSDLEAVQQNTTICDYYNKTKCDLRFSDIQEKLGTSQNSGELSYLWTEWRKATEPEFKKLLEKHVKLSNLAAILNHYDNFREYTLRNVEAEDIKKEMITLWEDVKPLYSQIHAYVRRKLRDVYGEKLVSSKGPIPAYLLGNIWSENWSGIVQRMIPFPEQDNFNFSSTMHNLGFTLESMHKSVEEFFAAMNFSVPSNLWFSVQETSKAKDSNNCHPKIFNFYHNGVRIRDCEKVSLKNYLEDIRLLSKAEYMLQYSGQPFIYQTPADPGLEEAVSDMMVMSASTFGNLKKLGLFKGELTEELRLNRLFKQALEKITSISFLLVQELWRWDVYSGKTDEGSTNIVNDLREKFQGISTFTKELTFDPGGIGSVFSKLSLAHHFFGYFLEFQLYESLCQKVFQNEKDLNECNLSQNVEAGVALRNMMSLGSSKTLSETISSILGVAKINSKSIMTYFDPLMKWLTKENEKTGEYIGWEKSETPLKNESPKTRRKRSLEDYPSEVKDDDTDNTPSREPDRFQRLIYKRSKNNLDELEMNERERKSTENEQSEKKSKSPLTNAQKHRRNTEEKNRRMYYTKNRRSLTKNNKNIKESSKESVTEEEKGSDNTKKISKYTSRNIKRHSGLETFDQSYDKTKSYTKNLNNREQNMHKKRSDDFGVRKNYKNPAIGNNPNNNNNAGSESNNNKKRFARGPRNQRQYDNEAASAQDHKIWRRKENYQSQRPSRNAQWHSDTKKDISRLLHSFGFAVESDDKDKIKELKKKLKGDLTSDLNSNIASKEGTYENMVDYNRMKSPDGRGDTTEDKGTNKLWSMKSYLTENSKIMQSGSQQDKKDSFSSSHLTSSLMGHGSGEEKSIGKKETSPNNEPSLATGKERGSEASESHLLPSGESGVRHVNIDMPSLQALLQKADMNSYGQRQIFTITPELSDSKAKYEMNPMYRAKPSSSKYTNSYLYKYVPTGDSPQYKEKKEFREDLDIGNKSPYIIILGQMAPDMKEKLMQEKGVNFLELDKQSQLQGGSTMEEKKMSDKRSRASEQIYIVPVDFKNTQHSLMKPNHYAEHEHEAGHDPNTERDQESEEEQLHLEDNSKLEDKSNFYKTGKESPSEFIISWNNDKNRKIVKRSKREHKKEIGDDKMKVVRIAPMKDSFLEGLLGKSIDHANLDENNVKILIRDGLLNGNSDLSSALSASQGSVGNPVGMSSPVVDQTQTASLQPSSSLSSLASSVLSALSPKSYSQVAKASNQHQESDLEEENLKDNANAQGLGKKKGVKLYSDDDAKKLIDVDPAAKGDDACCKKIILTPCPPKCPCPGPCPCPCPLPCPLPCPCPCPCPSPCPPPCPCPCPEDCCKRIIECPPLCCKPDCCPDLCCKKPSECSLVNCQFKITKAKKPHERLTIMIYDRINPPAELPEPYDALAVISEILQRIQCCPCKPCCQLTEEDPDYPANDNSDQLKGNSNQPQDNKAKIQELSGEIPILGSDSPEEDETDDNSQMQSAPNSADEDKYQPKEKATPAIDQLTVFNKDKLKPVFIELRKIDDIIKKRSQKE